MQFSDRFEAGRRLAEQVTRLDLPDPIVLALPRGGVPVGFEVAAALQAPLDVFVVRKIGAPTQPELGVGAIAEGGEPLLDDATVRALRLSADDLAPIIERERAEVVRRLHQYRGDAEPPPVRGRSVVLVDDGLATGVTARAALLELRLREPSSLILAVPVCAPETAQRLRADADEVVCVHAPERFGAVGMWYRDFAQTASEEVVELLRRARHGGSAAHALTEDRIDAAGASLVANLEVPAGASAVVAFAHGSGSSRFSPRNLQVAAALRQAGLGTLLLDLLTPDEERIDDQTRALRFDIDLLAGRLVGVVDWLAGRPNTAGLRVGLFGASTGAAAALLAAAWQPGAVGAIVARGGRPDLAGDALGQVRAPTLLIVGGRDEQVLELNREAQRRLSGPTALEVVGGATHLFSEPGAMPAVTRLATSWFTRHLAPRRTR